MKHARACDLFFGYFIGYIHNSHKKLIKEQLTRNTRDTQLLNIYA